MSIQSKKYKYSNTNNYCGILNIIRAAEELDNQPVKKKIINKDYTYTGYIMNKMPHGKGIIHYNNSSFFCNFINGKPEKGIIRLNNKCIYNGYIQNYKPYGNGILITNLGNLYNCIFDNGKPTVGIIVYKNGYIYKGAINNYKPCGEGTFIFNNNIIKGKFKDGVCYEQYVLIKNNEKNFSVYSKESTEQIDDHISKYTKDLIINNNEIYIGPIINNLPHGKGIIIKKSGEVYIGIFVNGQLSKGIIKYNKKIYFGYINKGKPCGDCAIIDENMNIYKEKFPDNIFIIKNESYALPENLPTKKQKIY